MSVDLEGAAAAVEALLVALGHPPGSDPELAETGRRVAEAMRDDLLAGYRADAGEILGESTSATSPGLVAVTDIAALVMCPHHLLPALGVAHVAYWPGEKLVGLGALARLVDCFGRRLVLQEVVAQQVADALVTHLGARASACMLDLAPTCVQARGERQARARSVSLAVAGEDDARLRDAMLARFPTPRGPA
ncbi:MAG: GTP cyclohydrolase I [Myxococcota bacterium]